MPDDLRDGRFGFLLVAPQFIPVAEGEQAANGRHPGCGFPARERGELIGEDIPNLLPRRVVQPRHAFADERGKGLRELGCAADRGSGLVAMHRVPNEGVGSFLEGSLVQGRWEVAHDALELEFGDLLDQAFHLLEMSKNGAGRYARAFGDLLGRGAQDSGLEAVEHGLRHRRSGPFGSCAAAVCCVCLGIH